MLVILFLQIRQSQVEVHKGKLGIRIGGRLKFLQRLIVLLQIQMIFPNEELVFRRTVSDLDQLRGGAVVEFLLSAR